MAREIHDSLAQAFPGIRMQIEAATRLLTIQPEQANNCLSRAQQLAHLGLNEARRSVLALQSETIDAPDLFTALQTSIQLITADTSLKTQVSLQGTAYALPQDIERNLLRIGQEALTNALRHAQK